MANTQTASPKTNVWLVIEITRGIADVDRQGAIRGDESGKIVRVPDETRWEPLLPEEVPEWLKSEDAIRDMVAGERLCLDAESGGHFYRAITCYPNATNTVN